MTQQKNTGYLNSARFRRDLKEHMAEVFEKDRLYSGASNSIPVEDECNDSSDSSNPCFGDFHYVFKKNFD